ncbi:sensor histidine kinase [Umezawaea tangerina]|uniref:sensor histidine kinase n=1 Tax=Umezawaea tangerina TaxID=84725 RepID=UPI0011B22766|nr:sensor histidine kinase [Umezawaea tangerina]
MTELRDGTRQLLVRLRALSNELAVLTGQARDLVVSRTGAGVLARERERLHRDMHDDLGPTLAGIRLRLDTASARLTDDPVARQLVLDAAAETARTMDEIRRTIDGLPPPDLAREGLSTALRMLAARTSHTSTAVAVTVPDHPPALSEATELAAYRIAAEALINVLRHADARHVDVGLFLRDDHVVLEVADDGAGPPPAGWWGDGTGLFSMRRRAEELGGSCVVVLRMDGTAGTLVRAVLPRGPA